MPTLTTSFASVLTPRQYEKTWHYPWTEGQTVNLSIGQGTLQVSPLQLQERVLGAKYLNTPSTRRQFASWTNLSEENGEARPGKYRPHIQPLVRHGYGTGTLP